MNHIREALGNYVRGALAGAAVALTTYPLALACIGYPIRPIDTWVTVIAATASVGAAAIIAVRTRRQLRREVESLASTRRRPHMFTIRVDVRMHGADWSCDLEPQTVEAYDVVDALQCAAMIPVGEWAQGEQNGRSATL